MGCFGVGCGVSKLPINCGEKAGIVLISKSKYSMLDAYDSSCNLVSNNGSYGSFFALALPIFGYYDDYGRLEDYIEDENFQVVKKMIEEHSYSFDEFMEGLYCGDAPLLNGMKVAGMFIHGTVYDTIVNENKGCSRSLDVPDYVMELIGFHKTDEDTGDKRYKHMYRYKDTPIEIHHDNTWGHIMHEGKQHSMYHPYNLKEVIKKLYDIDIDISMFDGISKYDIKFDQFQKTLSDTPNTKGELLNDLPEGNIPEREKKLLEAFRTLSRYDLREIYRASGFHLSDSMDYNSLQENYKAVIVDGSIKKQLVAWMRFYWFMLSTNTLIQPSMLGEQHGNYAASKKLYEIALKVTEERLSEYEEYNEY